MRSNAQLVEPFGGRRNTDESAPEFRHEMTPRGVTDCAANDQIGLRSTVGIIHDNDIFAFADLGDDGFQMLSKVFFIGGKIA